jgi:hypothetical protein
VRGVRSRIERGVIGSALLIVLGCMETPDTIPWTAIDAGNGATGGTGLGSAGTTAAGSGPIAGTAGMAGASGMSAMLDPATIPCDYPQIMQEDCAHAGCHLPTGPLPMGAGSLDLSPNAGLVARLKDVPARHLNINCAPPGQPIVECTSVPPACPTDALLVDSSNWEASFIISKLRGTTVGCGDQMREPDYPAVKPDREACIESVIRAIASLPK